MTIFFECVDCGAISEVEEPPPKCGRCGHGSGVVHLENPAKEAAPAEAPRASAPDPMLRRAAASGRGITTLLSNPELLLLEERCIDGEARCEERAEAARRRGDFAAAAFEVQLREQYRRLRLRMRDRRNHDTRPDLPPTAPGAQAMRSGAAAQPAPRDEE